MCSERYAPRLCSARRSAPPGSKALSQARLWRTQPRLYACRSCGGSAVFFPPRGVPCVFAVGQPALRGAGTRVAWNTRAVTALLAVVWGNHRVVRLGCVSEGKLCAGFPRGVISPPFHSALRGVPPRACRLSLAGVAAGRTAVALLLAPPRHAPHSTHHTPKSWLHTAHSTIPLRTPLFSIQLVTSHLQPQGKTAFLAAVAAGRTAAAALLLSRGADVDRRTTKGSTALLKACKVTSALSHTDHATPHPITSGPPPLLEGPQAIHH